MSQLAQLLANQSHPTSWSLLDSKHPVALSDAAYRDRYADAAAANDAAGRAS